MKDGLYRVETMHICGGFIIKNDRVTHCAPILRKKIEYWKKVAKWICEDPDETPTIPHRE